MTLREFVEFGIAVGLASRQELEGFETGLMESAAREADAGRDGMAVYHDLPLTSWAHIFRYARLLFDVAGVPRMGTRTTTD